jgi:hypothetical protein
MLRLFVALSIIGPTAAFAENTIPFPDYPDPTNACRQEAVAAGNKTQSTIDSAANDCIAEAQRSYNFSKAIWPRLTQQTATTCVNHVNGLPRADAWHWQALASCASSLYSTQPLPPQVFTK